MIEMTHPDLDETCVAHTPGQARAFAASGWQPVDPTADIESAPTTAAAADDTPTTED